MLRLCYIADFLAMVVWSKVVPRKPDSFADEGCGGYSQPQVYLLAHQRCER